MTEAALRERTARRLGACLEDLGGALEQAAVAPEAAARLLESASLATAHAVTLGLLTAARASELWADAAERHPAVAALVPAAARYPA